MVRNRLRLRGQDDEDGIPGVVGSVVVTGTSLASGVGSAFVPITPHGSSAEAGGYRFDLGELDDVRAPRAWQGPIRITSRGTTGCTVEEDVAIVEEPLAWSGATRST